MALKSRRQFPPGGFAYFQPQTGWNSSPGFTFDQVVDEIIQHRKKNPRFASQWTLDRESVANELDFFTCLRINFDPNYCTPETGAIAAGVKKKTPLRQWNFPQSLQSGVDAAAARVGNAAAGVGVVLDWLGDSLEPVAMDLAERRAAICATCPQNQDPDWLQRLENWAAQGVKQLIKLKTDLEISTPFDNQLHNCVACDCCLTLKIWAKMEHIKKYTGDEVKAKLDPRCWMLSEWDSA